MPLKAKYNAPNKMKHELYLSILLAGKWGGSFYWRGASIRENTVFLLSNSSVRTMVNNYTFTSNTAIRGAGTYTIIFSCSLDPNSSLILQTFDTSLTSNTAGYGTAGIHTTMHSCSLHPYSSLTLEASNTVFTSNVAGAYGAAIHTYVYSCSLHPYSSLALRITDSNYTSNIAGEAGAGIHTILLSCSLYPNSVFTFEATGSILVSNTADRGASLYMLHYSNDTCVSGEIKVAIKYCRFLNNSASNEGGLYFQVFPMTKLFVQQSAFESNQALPGSGLYRENINFPTCNPPTSNIGNNKMFIQK